jgi:hypothetical protein
VSICRRFRFVPFLLAGRIEQQARTLSKFWRLRISADLNLIAAIPERERRQLSAARGYA